MQVQKIPMSKIRQKYTKLPIDRKWIILALLVYILCLILKINIFPIIFLTVFCVANAIVLSIDRYVQAPLDLELSTFSAVLLATRYGIQWGIAAAVLTKFAAIFYNKNIRVDHFFMIGGYVIAAIFANIFRGMPIILLGVLVTLIVNLYVVFISKYVTMLSSYEILTYGLSNTLFNTVLFIGFSEIILKLMI